MYVKKVEINFDVNYKINCIYVFYKKKLICYMYYINLFFKIYLII